MVDVDYFSKGINALRHRQSSLVADLFQRKARANFSIPEIGES